MSIGTHSQDALIGEKQALRQTRRKVKAFDEWLPLHSSCGHEPVDLDANVS
jgi:hypothetical protein